MLPPGVVGFCTVSYIIAGKTPLIKLSNKKVSREILIPQFVGVKNVIHCCGFRLYTYRLFEFYHLAVERGERTHDT